MNHIEHYDYGKHFHYLLSYIKKQNKDYNITHFEYFKLKKVSLCKTLLKNHNILIDMDIHNADILGDLFNTDFSILQKAKNIELSKQGIKAFYIELFLSQKPEKDNIFRNKKLYTGISFSWAISFDMELHHDFYYDFESDQCVFSFNNKKSKYYDYDERHANLFMKQSEEYKYLFLKNFNNSFTKNKIEKKVNKVSINSILSYYVNYGLSNYFLSSDEVIQHHILKDKKETESYLQHFINNQHQYTTERINEIYSFCENDNTDHYIYSLKSLVLECIAEDLRTEKNNFIKKQHIDTLVFQVGYNNTIFRTDVDYYLKCEGDEHKIEGFTLYKDDQELKYFDLNKDFLIQLKDTILADTRFIFTQHSRYNMIFNDHVQNRYIKPLKLELQAYLCKFMDEISFHHIPLKNLSLQEINSNLIEISFYYKNKPIGDSLICANKIDNIKELGLDLLANIEKYEVSKTLNNDNYKVNCQKTKRL